MFECEVIAEFRQLSLITDMSEQTSLSDIAYNFLYCTDKNNEQILSSMSFCSDQFSQNI